MTDRKTKQAPLAALYADGQLVCAVRLGRQVRAKPFGGMARLEVLHGKRFATVDDLLAFVRLLMPEAAGLELRGGASAPPARFPDLAGEQLSLFAGD